ncbi:MAG TPA: hypothetical protein VHB51_03750 [Candidatus Saccharimonadales bacterium]|nr:hypothetical protein [Candidatus Saccharimonadales bacterium]
MRGVAAGTVLATGLTLAGCASGHPEAVPRPVVSPALDCDQPRAAPLLVEDCEAVVKTGFEPYYPVVRFALKNVTVYQNELPRGPVIRPTDVEMVLLDSVHTKSFSRTNSAYTPEDSGAFYERKTRVDTVFDADTMDPEQEEVVTLHELNHAYYASQRGYPMPSRKATNKEVTDSVLEEIEMMTNTQDFMKVLYGQKYADFIDKTTHTLIDANGVFPEITRNQLESALGMKLNTEKFNFFLSAVKYAAVFEAYDLTYGRGATAARNYKFEFVLKSLGGK